MPLCPLQHTGAKLLYGYPSYAVPLFFAEIFEPVYLAFIQTIIILSKIAICNNLSAVGKVSAFDENTCILAETVIRANVVRGNRPDDTTSQY